MLFTESPDSGIKISPSGCFQTKLEMYENYIKNIIKIIKKII